MKKLLVCGLTYLGVAGIGYGASFELIDSSSYIGMADLEPSPLVELEERPAREFTSYDGKVAMEGIGFASQSIQISAEAGTITSNSYSVLDRGFKAATATGMSAVFEVFEPTSYSFEIGEFSVDPETGNRSTRILLYDSNSSQYLFQRSISQSLDRTLGESSGVLEAGRYKLSGSTSLQTGGAPVGTPGGHFANNSFTLNLGGGAGVPEASEGVCLLAGSLMFVLAGTRRRKRID